VSDPVDEDPLLGRTLAGRYRLIARLGSGGNAAVYLARHVLIERLSAIKVLHTDLVADDQNREHFLREARAVNRINHPNIVEINDYGEAMVTIEGEGRRLVVYLVMEYVPGESLHKVIQRGPLSPTRAIPIVMQVASALARAHQTGVIHRDIKPENILLVARKDGDDLVKLTDFGVAKIAQSPRSLPAGLASDQVFGTPGWIAPEYLLGETAIDGRADLYSLGVVLYQAVTGQLPFDGDEAQLLTRPLVEEPIPASQRVHDLPAALDHLISRCLRRRPDERPHDAFAMLDELEAAGAEIGLVGIERTPAPQGEVRTRPTPVHGTNATYHVERPSPVAIAQLPPAPRLGMVTPGALVNAWRAHFEALDRRLAPYREGGAMPPPVQDVDDRWLLLVEGLDRAATLVVETQRALDRLEGSAREFRDSLGRAIDTLAHDLSREHGKMLALKDQRTGLHMQRRGAARVAQADALLWEEAAVDDEMRRWRALVEDLGFQIGALQDQLFARNVTHENEVQRCSGVLEGEAAALATLHKELSTMSGVVVEFLGLRKPS